jgi:geranylgeranyl diphosphate synthase type II
MHDDIMDEAPLRRGKTTVHTKWDVNRAILSGDVMFAQAYQLLLDAPSSTLKNVLEVITKNAIIVCEGQQMDMDFQTQQNVSIDDYIDMIGRKTAALIASSLYIGACISNTDINIADKLYKIGYNLGIAFQLHDDYLDVFGDENLTGKQNSGDILAHKKTFLYLYTLSNTDTHTKNYLSDIYSGNITLPNHEKIKEVKVIFEATKSKEALLKLSQEYYQNGMEELLSMDVTYPNNKQILIDFIQKLMYRKA